MVISNRQRATHNPARNLLPDKWWIEKTCGMVSCFFSNHQWAMSYPVRNLSSTRFHACERSSLKPTFLANQPLWFKRFSIGHRLDLTFGRPTEVHVFPVSNSNLFGWHESHFQSSYLGFRQRGRGFESRMGRKDRAGWDSTCLNRSNIPTWITSIFFENLYFGSFNIKGF